MKQKKVNFEHADEQNDILSSKKSSSINSIKMAEILNKTKEKQNYFKENIIKHKICPANKIK